MTPTRVLHLLPELDPGGAERVVVNLARCLPRERFDVSVAALDGSGTVAAELADLGIAIHDLGLRRVAPLAGPRRVHRLVNRLKPDILHSHLFRAHLAATGARCPVRIMTEHQADPRPWALRLLRLAARHATLVAAVSDGVRRHLVERAAFDAARVVTVANGIDLAPVDAARPADRADLGLPAEAALVLFVGRLTHQKGVDVLLDAAARLAPLMPHLRVAIAGDGPDRDALRQRAERLAVADRVRFLGRREDVPALMKAADVVALPSRWEGLSLVLLEATAAGVPVVAAAAQGHDELVIDGRTGRLVPQDNLAALAEALGAALQDRDASRRLAGEAQRRVRQSHSAEAMAARWASVYDRALFAERK